MISEQLLQQRILANLPYKPTLQQSQLIAALAKFCTDPSMQPTVFVLNGYAGTGKTSLVAALVNALEDMRVNTVLLAPTGRAAKVLSGFSGHSAYTVHRYIYRTDFESGQFTSLKENKSRPGTVFIVDESSMIDSTDNESKSLNLLDDLLQYVYSGDECRLIFLGDTAQLPSVSSNIEIPLHLALRKRFFHVLRASLTATVRQAADSGILYNATWLRKAMARDEIPMPKIFSEQFDDVSIIGAEDLPDELQKSYSDYGMDETIIITRSNKRAVDYNLAVRNLILERTSMLSRGDMLMIAKNNYFWTKSVKGLEFIANGDMAIVEKVIGEEEFAGMTFADVELSFPDHDDITLQAKINITSLVSDAPAITAAELRRLGMACIDNPDVYPPGTPDSVRIQGLRKDPYYNALQVKYGYAITCHKAQGGQWMAVFIDIGFLPEDTDRLEFYRWLYTAVTRASKEVYFINPGIVIE